MIEEIDEFLSREFPDKVRDMKSQCFTDEKRRILTNRFRAQLEDMLRNRDRKKGKPDKGLDR